MSRKYFLSTYYLALQFDCCMANFVPLLRESLSNPMLITAYYSCLTWRSLVTFLFFCDSYHLVDWFSNGIHHKVKELLAKMKADTSKFNCLESIIGKILICKLTITSLQLWKYNLKWNCYWNGQISIKSAKSWGKSWRICFDELYSDVA